MIAIYFFVLILTIWKGSAAVVVSVIMFTSGEVFLHALNCSSSSSTGVLCYTFSKTAPNSELSKIQCHKLPFAGHFPLSLPWLKHSYFAVIKVLKGPTSADRQAGNKCRLSMTMTILSTNTHTHTLISYVFVLLSLPRNWGGQVATNYVCVNSGSESRGGPHLS